MNDPTQLFPMDGNDTLGDCTIAALAHAITVYHGLVDTKRIMAKQPIVKLYMHLTGGVDSGLNELDVLNYWRKTSVDGDKILGFVKIDPKNHTTSSWRSSFSAGCISGSRCSRTPSSSSTRINPGHRSR